MSNHIKTKIFFDAFPIALPRLSGIGHLILETIRALEQTPGFADTYELILLAPESGKKYIDAHNFTYAQCRSVPLKGRVWSALILWGLMPPVDLLFGGGVYVFGNYTTWPTVRSKVITYVHDLNFIVNPNTVQEKTRKVLSRHLPVWLRRAHVIATISEFSKREIVQHFPAVTSKVRVVLCGVDTDVFRPAAPEQIKLAKQRYGIPGEYILFLSNIEPRKNVLRCLEAYEQLDDQLTKKYSLVLIGAGGWLNDSIIAKIDDLRTRGYAILWPQTYVPDSDLPPLLSGARVLLHPALYEGFGISPLQALACGTPVVVSKTSSLPEVAGACGHYVDPTNTDEIVQSLSSLLSRKKESPLAGITHAQTLSWSRAAGTLRGIIDDLVQ